MAQRSLEEWLRWQESLYPRWIELGLDRVREVFGRQQLARPAGPVFTVAGTNGKGSTVALLEALLLEAGHRPGVYTSPHLVSYNERIRVAGVPATDAMLLAAFERVETARAGVPLTFFEFGTLAALQVFATAGCDCWILEVGMGGRLDAVNIIDADYALITTVALDHQEFLGNTVEQIAAEKAGILRPERPGFFGDQPLPAAVRDAAARLGTPMHCAGRDFGHVASRPRWSWRGRQAALEGLEYPPGGTPAQLRNISLVLAAIEQYRPQLLADTGMLNRLIGRARPPGRFQVVEGRHQWVLDVAHNPQAVATLRAQLDTLPAAPHVTAVIGLLGDKSLDAFMSSLGDVVDRWICCTVEDGRARAGASIAGRLRELGAAEVLVAAAPAAALDLAGQLAPLQGRIIVCGSFRMVGPALRWLDLY
ncbi:MAG: bifunctional folylpolyglutamate synthase/dihydrofolate synthase [Gammaproteobacteria bacterium]|nr:bifunctional folylpolyglutamate synthase/dihydrofolate synthase [Gammaproteobacteria bacterium]